MMNMTMKMRRLEVVIVKDAKEAAQGDTDEERER